MVYPIVCDPQAWKHHYKIPYQYTSQLKMKVTPVY
jgi:hypothetical protein